MRREGKQALMRYTRDTLGRYLRAETLRKCAPLEACELTDTGEDWRRAFREHDELLAEIEDMALASYDDGFGQWIRDRRRLLSEEFEHLAAREAAGERIRARSEADMLRAEFEAAEAEPAHRFVATVEVDRADVTGLDAPEARELALRLAAWNGPGPVYKRRHGRRYLHPRIFRVDLNDPLISGLPFAADLEQLVGEGRIDVIHEDITPRPRRRGRQAAGAGR